MAAVIFREADDSEIALLKSVWGEWHTGLDGFDIGLVFRDQPQVIDGRPAAATANKASPTVAFLTGLDGWIEICELYWDDGGEDYHRFLLDHELSHFEVNEKGNLVLIGHSFQDFDEVLERHSPSVTGLWRLQRDWSLGKMVARARPAARLLGSRRGELPRSCPKSAYPTSHPRNSNS